MANIQKHGLPEHLERIKREYIRIHIEMQRQYLERQIEIATKPGIEELCNEALSLLDHSRIALEGVLNGYHVDVINALVEEDFVPQFQLELQNLMDVNSQTTKLTYVGMALKVIKDNMGYEDAYKASVQQFIRLAGPIGGIARQAQERYHNSDPRVQLVAAVAVNFLRYLNRVCAPQVGEGTRGYIAEPKKLLGDGK